MSQTLYQVLRTPCLIEYGQNPILSVPFTDEESAAQRAPSHLSRITQQGGMSCSEPDL